MSTDASPRATRLRRTVAWGAVDQGLSSATNLGLTLIAARLVGPSGLGVVSIGFSAYLLALIVQRTLLSQPVILESTTSDRSSRDASTRVGVTVTIGVGLVASAILFLMGLVLDGTAIGRGASIFAAWMPSCLLQDYWRSILFRDARGRDAAVNDLVWLVGMALTVPLAFELRSDVTIVATWGLGATIAAAVGFRQVGLGPAPVGTSWQAWRRGDGWRIGRWFTAEGIAYTGLSQAVIWVLAAMLGPGAVGGLRAARTVFAPLTLFGPAVALPGLPAMVRALHVSTVRARALALKLSALLVGVSIPYFLFVAVLGEPILSLLFGAEFGRFQSIAVPIAAQQTLLAAGTGLYLFLKAARRGQALLTFRLIEAAATLALVVVAAREWELVGAAWAITAGAAFGLVWKVYCVRVVMRNGPTESGPLDDAADGVTSAADGSTLPIVPDGLR